MRLPAISFVFGSDSFPLMKTMRSLKIDKRPAEKLLTAKIAKNCRQARKKKTHCMLNRNRIDRACDFR